MTGALLAWFEGPAPTTAALRALARDRLAQFQRLRLTPQVPAAEAGAHDWPLWRPTHTGFSAEHHVRSHPSTASLDTLVADLLTEPLDRAAPPWQLHLIPTTDGFALLVRAHHALLDGGSLFAVLCALLGQGGQPRGRGAHRAPARTEPSRGRQLAWALDDLLPKGRPMPFHGDVDAGRTVSFSHVSRQELNAARDALTSATPSARASNNAVFLAATAGALRTLGLTGRLPQFPGVCAMVPVDVRTDEQATLLGNHYATVRIPLPAQRDPQRRLATVNRHTQRDTLKQRARAQAAVVSGRPRRFTSLGDAAGRYVDSPRYFSLLCTSVAIPEGAPALGPARLTATAGMPPLGPGHPLAVSMLHHHTGAVVTTVTDQHRGHLATPLTSLIHEEIRRLAG